MPMGSLRKGMYWGSLGGKVRPMAGVGPAGWQRAGGFEVGYSSRLVTPGWILQLLMYGGGNRKARSQALG